MNVGETIITNEDCSGVTLIRADQPTSTELSDWIVDDRILQLNESLCFNNVDADAEDANRCLHPYVVRPDRPRHCSINLYVQVRESRILARQKTSLQALERGRPTRLRSEHQRCREPGIGLARPFDHAARTSIVIFLESTILRSGIGGDEVRQYRAL